MVTFTSSDKFSGVGCQQPNSTRCVAVAHEMNNFSPGSAFSFYQIGAHGSGFGIYSYETYVIYYKNVVFFLIKLTAFQASGGARMRLRMAEPRTAEQQNIKPQNIEG